MTNHMQDLNMQDAYWAERAEAEAIEIAEAHEYHDGPAHQYTSCPICFPKTYRPVPANFS
jgi:hypothetical protein